MKSIKYYLIISLATIFSFSSCEDNFDPKIYGQFIQSNYPNTKDDYISVAMACYIPFCSHWSYNFMNAGSQHTWYIPEGGLMRLFDGTSDIMAPMVTTALGSDWLRFSQANFSNCVNYARGAMSQNVINHFQAVGEVTRMTQILGLIEKAPEDVLDTETKAQLLSEVRLCRGLHMYYTFHIYGPLPFITNPDEIYDDEALFNMARPTLESAVKKITDDFEFAATNMPEKASVTEKGRYNRDYARYLLMRHCLNEGSHMEGYYQKALDMYEGLKGKYTLFTTGDNPYADQFISKNKFNSEVIMAVSVSPTSTAGAITGNGNVIGMYMIPLDVSNTLGDNPQLDPHGPGWNHYYNMSVKFYDSFEANDLRAKTVLTEYKAKDGSIRKRSDIGSKWSGFIINKFRPEVKATSQPMDIPLARWADALLMYAEALTRKNNSVSEDAVNAVNEVRKRAGIGVLSATKTANAETFLDAILLERGHELFYEGGRKIDLIRFNVYAQKCKDIKGVLPTHQYMPIPNFAVNQAAEHGITLDQTYSRPGWSEDISKAE